MDALARGGVGGGGEGGEGGGGGWEGVGLSDGEGDTLGHG